MKRLGWLTPDTLPTTTLRRWLCIPDEPAFLAVVTGALLRLTYAENWEAYGAVTPQEAADAMSVMLEGYFELESECMKLQHEPIFLSDQKAQNTNGGTFSSGAWRQRTLNTKQGDTHSLVALSSNRFTLSPGRWAIEWSAPAHNVQRHQTLLYNVTGAIGLQFGTSEFTNTTSPTQSRSKGFLVLDVPSAIQCEIQHQCQTSVTNLGFGVPANFGTEIFTEVKLTFIS